MNLKTELVITGIGGLVASVFIYTLGFYYPQGHAGRWNILVLWGGLLIWGWTRWRQSQRRP